MNPLSRPSATSDAVEFDFEGRQVLAKPGQSVAGALYEAGVSTLSRSVKFHRPRGYQCGFGACGNCQLTVNGLPGTNACQVEPDRDTFVTRQGGFPNADTDVLRAADYLRPFIPAGFQFRLFPKHPKLSKLAGTVMAQMAGGGRLPEPAAAFLARAKEVEQRREKLTVVGAGLSGITAALAAARTTEKVVLIDAGEATRRSNVRTEPVRVADSDVSPAEALQRAVDALEREPRIEVVRGFVAGMLDGLLIVTANEGTSRPRRIEIESERLILATGSYEVPMLIEGADLPGVFLADGALKLVERERVRLGRRVFVIGEGSRADAVATRLRTRGLQLVGRAPESQVVRIVGGARATGVVLHPDRDERRAARLRRVTADVVCIAGGRRAANELVLQAMYLDAGSHERVVGESESARVTERVLAVGSAAGNPRYSLEDIENAVEQFVQ